MIFFAFMIFHILIVMFIYVLMVSKIIKIDGPMMAIVVCVPFFGTVCAVMVTLLKNAHKVGDKNDDLEVMKGSSTAGSDIVVEAAESANIVPLEDALIMDDPSIRRSVMLDVLMSDSRDYMPVINQARMNDDVEVVHYATTAMVELSKEYDLKIQEYSGEYAQDPDKEGLLDEYIDFLEQYIGSGMIQGQLLEIQRSTYLQLLTRKVSLAPTVFDYGRLVRGYLSSGQYAKADAALKTMEENWQSDDSTWLLRFRYYVETGSGAKVRQMVEEVKNSTEYYSRDIRDAVDFWDKKDVEAAI